MNELVSNFVRRILIQVIPVIQTRKLYTEIRKLDPKAPDVLEFISIDLDTELEFSEFEAYISEIRHELLRQINSNFTTWPKIEVFIDLRIHNENMDESVRKVYGRADIEIQLFSE